MYDVIILSQVVHLPTNAADLEGECTVLDETVRQHASTLPFLENGIEDQPDSDQLWGLSSTRHRCTWKAASYMNEQSVGYGKEEAYSSTCAVYAGVKTM